MTVKLDKSVYAGMVKTSGEMLDSIIERIKVDFSGDWTYSNAQEVSKLADDLADMGKPLKLCQALKGLAMLATAPWQVTKPEQTGKTYYQVSKLGYTTWAVSAPTAPTAPTTSA